MLGLEVSGWGRTTLLGLGGTGGVVITAGIIHLLKKGHPEREPTGWLRTAMLATGGFGGTMATALLIHAAKGGQGGSSLDPKLFKFMRRFAPDRYQDALAEAKRIEDAKGIPMTVEALKPVHFGWAEYKLPVGSTSINLKDNVCFYPVGIFSTDEDFTALKWWRGARVEYLVDWPVYFVALKKEKQATMTPQPIFKTSFTFEVVSDTPKAKVDAWILGYVVLPETMREMKVTR